MTHDHKPQSEPRDTRLDPLLDELLGADSVDMPDDLAQRIADRTAAQLPPGTPAVIGRIGFRTVASAIAAAVVLALGVGLWFAVQSEPVESPTVELAAIERDLEELESFGQLSAELEALTAELEAMEAAALAQVTAEDSVLDDVDDYLQDEEVWQF